MDGFFIMERQTEALLQPEAREVTLPDRSRRLIRDFKILWDDFDFLCCRPAYSEKALVELAFLSRSETGRSFEESFISVVAYAAKLARSNL